MQRIYRKLTKHLGVVGIAVALAMISSRGNDLNLHASMLVSIQSLALVIQVQSLGTFFK